MNKLKKYNILFLEDNETFAKSTVEFLELFFNKVYHCLSIKKSLELFQNNQIHFIISDIKVQDGNGLDFLSQIRQIDKAVVMVVISAHKEENFLFKAIELNLVTYKLKPLVFDDFIDIFQSVLPKLEESFSTLVHIKDDIFYDTDRKTLTVADEMIELNKKESLFMELLSANKNRVITKQMIQDYIWEDKEMSESALKNFVLRLRKKIDKDFLKTVPNLGVKL